MVKIVVEFHKTPYILDKARRYRKALVSVIEEAIKNLEIFDESQYAVNFSFE